MDRVIASTKGIDIPKYFHYNIQTFDKWNDQGDRMTNNKRVSWIFGTLGAVLAVVVLVICLTQRDAEPVLLRYPQEAENCVSQMMKNLCADNFRQASRYIYGEPELGAELPAGDGAAQLWDSFTSSLRYEPKGECYATATGLAQDVTVSSLDMSAVLQDMEQIAPQLLEQRVAQAKNMDEIYDADHEYLEEFLQDVMQEAAAAALENAETVQRPLTVNLLYDRRQWWVLPDRALLSAISGGILK